MSQTIDAGASTQERLDSRLSAQPAIVPFAAFAERLHRDALCFAGYRMIKNLSVENFRCFERFDLSDLKRVNILVGRNASGKTAFLEAIRLAFGATPSVAWTLSAQRGHPVWIQPNPTPEQFEAPWRPLFFNLDFKNEIKTAFVDSEGVPASLRIFLDTDNAFSLAPPLVQPGVPFLQPWEILSPFTPIAFQRTDRSGKESTLNATLHRPHPQQQQYYQMYLEPGPELGSGVEFFPSSLQVNSQQVAQWFSALSIANKEGPIKTAIKDEFGFISDLTIQSPQTNFSLVYATLVV